MAPTPNGKAAEPAWHAEFRRAYASTQAFILHGNVQDYVQPGLRLPQYLAQSLTKRDFGIVCFYDRARGITFAADEMEKRARKILDTDGGGAKVDPAVLALIGAQDGSNPDDLPRNLAAALPLLEKLLRSDTRTAVILLFGEHILPAQDVSAMAPEDRAAQIILRGWGTDKVIKDKGSVVFLVTDLLSDLSPAIRAASACWRTIELKLPDQSARAAFIAAYVAGWNPTMEMGQDELARATAGLSLVHIEGIFLQADSQGTLTWDLVRSAKAEIIRSEYAGLLTILEPTFGYEAVGGLEAMKAWATQEIIEPVRAGRLQDVPMGVLFVGPPGTGKTHFVRATAFEVKFQSVELHMSNVLSKWQGESERMMAKAIGACLSLAPVLVFMDELDQVEGTSREQVGGSPSSKNIMNQLLQFLGNPQNRGRVVFFAASNRPDLIDPAFRRSGRIDATIPFLLPNRAERLAVAKAQAAAQGCRLTDKAAALLADGSERYSSADVAALVTKARKIARRNLKDTITEPDAQIAIDTIRPATVAQAGYFENLALDACNDIELLPPEYRARKDKRSAEPPAQVAQEDGSVPKRSRREL